MGYILDNLIGVIYEDGSCILGTNASEYVYKSNEPINI